MIKKRIQKKVSEIYSLVASVELEKLNNLKLLLGQSAILASRSMSSKFYNLWDAEVRVFSQWGEDGILDFICQTLELSKPNAVEFGVGSFIECNTRYLAENRGASVFAVDSLPDHMYVIERISLSWKTHIFGHRELITPVNAQNILNEAKQKLGNLDIFSLDLDGNDYWILESMDLTEFKVIVVEYNSIFGAKHELSVLRDDFFDRQKAHSSCLYYGASLPAYVYLLANRGFTFIGSNRVCTNAFFVKNNLVNQFTIRTPGKLEEYTDYRVRESRDPQGRLSKLSGQDRLNQIKNLNLVNIRNSEVKSINEIFFN